MNNEIKEILEFKENADYKKLSCDEIAILRDYITNLQEQLHQASLDIQELTERDIECPSWCDKLTNLQQENERLKLNHKQLKDIDKIAISNSKLIKEKEELKSRIEKAVEYIAKLKNFKIKYVMLEEKELYATENDFVKELLDILNGRSDE